MKNLSGSKRSGATSGGTSHGEDRMTLTKLASLAKVSVSTASHVLNGNPHTRVSPATRKRIFRLAAETRYRPNLAARSLRVGRSGLVACVLPDLTSTLATRLILHLDALLRDAGFHTVVAHSGYDKREEIELAQRLIDHGVDALIIGAVGHPPDQPDPLKPLLKSPAVLMRLDGPDHIEGFDCVTYDDRAGIRQAIDHMLSMGHRRFAYVGQSDYAENDRARREAFTDRLAEEGITGADARIIDAGTRRKDGQTATRKLLAGDHPPTAIQAFNDHVALGVIDAVREAGLAVGRDMSVAGFDNTDLSQDPAYNLNSIYLPEKPWAEAIVDLTLNRLNRRGEGEAERHILTPRYIPRGSVGPPLPEG